MVPIVQVLEVVLHNKTVLQELDPSSRTAEKERRDRGLSYLMPGHIGVREVAQYDPYQESNCDASP